MTSDANLTVRLAWLMRERERERERERDVQIRLLGLALGHAPPLLFSIPNMQGFDIPTGDANPTLLLLLKEPLLLWVQALLYGDDN